VSNPLEQAARIVEEADAILALPPHSSAQLRIERFRAMADTLRASLLFQEGFRTEHLQLISLVSKLLDVLTRHSPNIHRVMREEPELREARKALLDYIAVRRSA
jgi:hypothetical protein